jgi:hypothetical protein
LKGLTKVGPSVFTQVALVIAHFYRISQDDLFGLLRLHVMFRKMQDVRIVPFEQFIVQGPNFPGD